MMVAKPFCLIESEKLFAVIKAMNSNHTLLKYHRGSMVDIPKCY